MSGSEYENHSSPPSPSPYEQHASVTATDADGPRTGLLSNVFSFVSREITEFVINATGVAESPVTRPVPGPSRERTELGRQTEKRHRRHSTPSHSQHDSHASKRVRTGVNKSSHITEPPANNGVDVVEYDVSGPLELATHQSQSPPARRPRKTSVIMPGSLFSRSPTPDESADARHVRFASGITSPIPRRQRPLSRRTSGVKEEQKLDGGSGQDDEEGGEGQYEEEDSEPNSDENSESCPASSPSRVDINNHLLPPPSQRSSGVAGPSSQPFPTKPFRPRTINSVKDVVTKLDEGSSPRPITPSWSPNGKGKARQTEMEPQILLPMMNKGKAASRSEVTYAISSSAASVDGAHRVDGVVRRTISDAESVEHTKGNRPAVDEEATKRRIQELEEKVRSLENELARRPPRQEPSAPPPPPPPPPPLPLGSTPRIPLTLSPRREPGVNNVLASLRAGLKTTNIPETSTLFPKNRLPTVPADKMEEFLSELKTVRLRRVGSGNLSQSTANSSSALEHSQSSSQESSLVEDRSVIGCKRKRLDSGKEVQGALVASMKRRFTFLSQPAAISASSVAPTSSTHLLLPPRSSILAHPRSSTAVSAVPTDADVTTPSLCSDNDNEAEERAPLTPPSLPSRPGISRFVNRLGDRRNNSAPAPVDVSVKMQAPREQHRKHEICGIPSRASQKMQSLPPSTQPPIKDRSLSSTSAGSLPKRQSPRTVGAADDPFSRRPPSSPMPPETPRRPRPPGRVRSGSKPVQRTSVRSRSRSRSLGPSGDADDDNSLSVSFAPPDASTPAPDPVRKRRPTQGQVTRKQRRATLDEEIRRVEVSYSDEERAVNKTEAWRQQSGYSDEERALQDLESGVFLGTGRRSKRLGFLAHGGAGGAPVMMGVGNVEGAVVEDPALGEQTTKDAKVGRGKRQIRSNAGGKRKPKR